MTFCLPTDSGQFVVTQNDDKQFAITLHDFMIHSANCKQVRSQIPLDTLCKKLFHLKRVMVSLNSLLQQIHLASEIAEQGHLAQASHCGDFFRGHTFKSFFSH
ncbi:hypothetical protein D3C85_1521880 [compost metagenome]